MALNSLSVALAVARDQGRERQLAVGGLLARDETDGGLSLLEAFAYVADVLAVDQDQSAAEAHLETSQDPDRDLVRVRFCADLRPVVFVVFDADRVYVAVVDADTGDAHIEFGEGERGKRPPPGFEGVAAAYSVGSGAEGNLSLTGLGLSQPLWVIALSRRAPLLARVPPV